jgi:CDP-diacylglycerol--serine O-phosphatidyltransferase
MNSSNKKLDKLAFFLPNSFTALNIGCGFMAIMFSIQGDFYKSCMLIILGAIFDSVDGRVARMTGTQSAFGEQFDSLSDLISFGIAPSIIFYNKFLLDSGRLGMVVSFLFLLCGALRLARFNANIDKVKSDYFQGLPIPGAAAAIIGFVLVSSEFPTYFHNKYIAIPYILTYSILMVSNIPFPSFKNSEWVRKNKRKILFILILAVSALFIYEELMFFVVISLYVLVSFLYALTHRSQMKDIFQWEDEENA